MNRAVKRREWVTWGSVVVGAAILIAILFTPPYIGVADNGDFNRIVQSGGIAPLGDLFSYADKYFGFVHSRYEYGPFAIGYVSSQVLFVFIAGLLGRMLHPTQFPMAVLGGVYALLLLGTLYVIVRHACGGERWLQITTALCVLFIFFDIGYVAYFHSFFGEAVTLLFFLLSMAIAIALARDKHPSLAWLILLFVCSSILSTAKLQNVPLGMLFALYTLRLYHKRSERSWKQAIVVGSSFLMITTVLMYALVFVFISEDLKQCNLYHAVFYGILKDSPHLSQDLEDLGLPQKYAVLAGTNYFQKNIPIKQNSVELKKNFYAKFGLMDVVGYYLRHPGRIIDKLEVASSQATFIRPYYLGSYEKQLGKPHGSIAYFYSVWSEWKKNYIPKQLMFFILFFTLYIGVVLKQYIYEQDKRYIWDVMLLVAVIAILSVAVALVGDGETELGKHLFLFNVSFDSMLIFIIIWIVSQLRSLFITRCNRTS